MNEDHVIKSLAALAHHVRLQVFRALVVAGADGLTPSVLVEALGVAATALSFHLKELVHAGLVTQERVSRNLVYRADFARMDGVLRYLTENCCAGARCEVTAPQCCPASDKGC
ncbi:ArsR/SmtB family transcription factor [Comamonas koreensis]|uniref:ArsR/SmtB family transcription factor n=1 Tax=Comamonas koreensis TaxID=160825 RepID=UPI0015FA35A3|nr:helix-turn-helix domain-containing protein [Comamonas koreensis]